MSKTGHAAVVTWISATQSTTRWSDMVWKAAVATALPNTSCAQVSVAAGVHFGGEGLGKESANSIGFAATTR